MSPDDPRWHVLPEAVLARRLNRQLEDPWIATSEPGVAFSRLWSLDGRLLPPSRLGPKTLEPDVCVFAGPPGFVDDERGRGRGFDTALLRLVIEVLSPTTHRQDLGPGKGDDVDRPRSDLDSGGPESWALNARPEAVGGQAPRAGCSCAPARAAGRPSAAKGSCTRPGRCADFARSWPVG